MLSQKMATVVANEPAVAFRPPTSYTTVWDDAGHRRCALSRFWKWLWSDQGVSDPETHDNPEPPSQGPIETSGKQRRART